MKTYTMMPNLLRYALPVICLLPMGLSMTRLDAALFDTYEIRPEQQFHFNTIATPAEQGPTVFDVLGDGRIVGVTTVKGASPVPHLFLETAVGSRAFDVIGALPLDPAVPWFDFGASFLSVSPSGAKVAVGNNGFFDSSFSNNAYVGIFDTTGLAGAGLPSVQWFSMAGAKVAPFNAKWVDDNTLAFTGTDTATFTFDANVYLLDTLTPAASPAVQAIVALGSQRAAADLVLDSEGNLYTANGFDLRAFSDPAFNPADSEAGRIKRFLEADWRNAATGTPLDFGSQGEDVAQILSGSSLFFDNEGNLLVGGADTLLTDLTSPELNKFVVYRPTDGAQRTFDPNNTLDGNSYNLVYNPITFEIYVHEPFTPFRNIGSVDNTLVYVVGPPNDSAVGIPEPASFFLMTWALCGLNWRGRRRRR